MERDGRGEIQVPKSSQSWAATQLVSSHCSGTGSFLSGRMKAGDLHDSGDDGGCDGGFVCISSVM